MSIDSTACLARTAREKAFFLQKPISNMSETVLCNGAKRDAVGTRSVGGELGQDRSQKFSSKETRWG